MPIKSYLGKTFVPPPPPPVSEGLRDFLIQPHLYVTLTVDTGWNR